MNKTLFPAILVIIALLFGTYFYFNLTSKPAHEGTPGPTAEVEEESETPVATARDVTSEENVFAVVGDTFSITLDSNATTGYTWRVQHDAGPITMTGQNYNAPTSGLMGAGGTETFNFKALAAGESELQFAYWREWEGEKSIIETKVYHVNVSPVGK